MLMSVRKLLCRGSEVPPHLCDSSHPSLASRGPGHSICPAAVRGAVLGLSWRSQGSLSLQEELSALQVCDKPFGCQSPKDSQPMSAEFSFSGGQPLLWDLDVPVPLRWLRCRWHYWSHTAKQPASPGARWMQQNWLLLQQLPAVSHGK